MNETEWLTGADSGAHLRHAAARLSPRRLRLLAVALCRTAAHLLYYPEVSDALDVIDRCADGLVPPAAMERARQECRAAAQRAYAAYRAAVDSATHDPIEGVAPYVRSELAWAVSFAAATPLPLEMVGAHVRNAVVQSLTDVIEMVPSVPGASDATGAAQHRALRAAVWEVAGNLFRTPHFLPEWRTDTVVSLARGMYDAREFSAMPILADALQDAGCDNEELLAHCRSEAGGGFPAGGSSTQGLHVRGCWALDLVLANG